MNLDLLKKLTRLANNNPNDHEANSAARRVCKMLEECNWILNDTIPPKQSNLIYDEKSNINYADVVNDFFNAGSKNTWADWFDDRYWKHAEYTRNKNYWTDFAKEKVKKEKRNLKCKTCGKVKETIFLGLEDVFECNPCQWTAYTRDKMK